MLNKRIEESFLEAYKAKDSIKKNTLGIVKSRISEWKADKKNAGKEISDQDIISILSSEVKKRNQAIDLYAQNASTSAQEHITAELQEIGVLKAFLPTQMTNEEMVAEIEKVKATSPDRLIAAVMQHFNKNFKGSFDNKQLQDLLK
jgi:hypothetical protein